MKLLIDTSTPLSRTEVPDDHVAGQGQLVLTEAEWQASYGSLVPPAPEPVVYRRQDTDTILQRLTSQEYQALHAAKNSNWAIDRLLMRAVSTGVIDESDPDFPAAVTGLDSAGAIAASRWDALLAP